MTTMARATLAWLCCLVFVGTGHSNGVFKIGLLAPWDWDVAFSAYTSASAVDIAVEKVHSDPTLNANGRIRLSVVSRDSGCDSKQTLGSAVDLWYNESVDVFIGPPCSIPCRSAAEVASFYNIPIVSWVATDPRLDDKTIYTTLGRTLGPFSQLTAFLLDVLKQYSWQRVVVISSNYFFWKDAGRAVKENLMKTQITLAYESNYDDPPSDQYIYSVFEKVKVEGRIVLLMCPREDMRRFMVAAYDLNMVSGDYVFYTVDAFPRGEILSPEYVWKNNDENDEIARIAFEAVFHISAAELSGETVDAFRVEVARRMQLPPWKAEIEKSSQPNAKFNRGNEYAAFLHDTVLLYAIALNDTYSKGQNVSSGIQVYENMRGKLFTGMSGNVILDDRGDRRPDYWIRDMTESGEFVRFAEVINLENGSRLFHKNLIPPRWPGGLVGHQHAPPDAPLCGFFNELCPPKAGQPWLVIVIVISTLTIVATALTLTVFLYRRNKFETSLLVQSWKNLYEDIEIINQPANFFRKTESEKGVHQTTQQVIAITELEDDNEMMANMAHFLPSIVTMGTQHRIHCEVGHYRGQLIALKHIQKEHMQVSREMLLEFNRMKELVHENLCVFVGASINPLNMYLLWHYCPKGSLRDILLNDDVKLDNTFKWSFMSDIANGMVFLHKSHLHSHGNLKSSNCLVDTTWLVKITDYGLPSSLARQTSKENEEAQYKRKLWTAPEILRETFPPPRGTPKGDVYSFAIVCYEIMMRSEPYDFDSMTARDAVVRVRDGESIPFRPNLPDSTELGKPTLELIKDCWNENTDQRPSFVSICAFVRKMAGGKIDIMDNVLSMMEKYANNLEELVEDRTQQLVEEKKKTDKLLSRLLPASVAEQLKRGHVVSPENYDQATIYFSDIVGFNKIAMESNPIQIVNFLSDLYSCFDNIIAKHDVYKVETIGHAYMVVSGVPVRNCHHARDIANVSLDLLSAAANFTIKHKPGNQLKLRIGLHSGPVVAGVVGLTMPRYCLFGNTVSIAERMESTGKPLRIHVSKQCSRYLKELDGYELSVRGDMKVTANYTEQTFWLHGRKGYHQPLPDWTCMDPRRQDSGQDLFRVGTAVPTRIRKNKNPDLSNCEAANQNMLARDMGNHVPDVPDRDVADRDVADRDVADRDVADRDVADRDVADVADRDMADPEVADRGVADRDVAERNMADPNVADPNMADPNVADPNVADRDVAERNMADPNVADPNMAVPNMADHNVADPNVADRDVADRDVADREEICEGVFITSHEEV